MKTDQELEKTGNVFIIKIPFIEGDFQEDYLARPECQFCN
jgi:hypothetical protein